MRPRLLLATGDEALDAALSARADVVACERLPEAALAAARREYPDAAVVAARLCGEETGALVEALLDEGVRVLWLSGRAREPRARGAAGAGFASCEVVGEPYDADDLMRRLDAGWADSPGGPPAGGAGRVADAVATYDSSSAAAAAGSVARASALADGEPGAGDGGRAADGEPVAGDGEPRFARGTGLTVFIGALPGCGTSTAAVAWARRAVAVGEGSLLLVDAHAERAHLAHLLLGRHLDPLVPADRSRSWRQARGAEALRRCVVEVSPGLHLLPLAFDPDPPEAYPAIGGQHGAPDLAVRWTASTVTADLVCGREFTPGDAVAVLRALGASGRVVRVRASGGGLSEADRGLWTQELGVWVAGEAAGSGCPAAPAARLVAEIRRALRVCGPVAPAWAVDLGAPPPLLAGVADPRVSWAAGSGHVVVVTRPGPVGAAAAERMLTTLRAEAGRAGARLRAEVVDGRGVAAAMR